MGIEIIVAVAVGIAVGVGTSSVAIGIVAGIGAALLFGSANKKPKATNPDFGGGSLASSPTFGRFGPLQNTISDKLPVGVIMGRTKVGGNVIWQSEPGEEVTQMIILGEGEIEEIEEIRVNDRPYQQFDGVEVELRYGTLNQGACELVKTADPDVEGMDLRKYAGLAVKLKSSDDLGGSATVTCVPRGIKAHIYNEAYHKVLHPFASGDVARPVNSSAVVENDGYYQVFEAPDDVRLADIEVGLSWDEGDQADEDNADWQINNQAYLQVYGSDGTVPTGDVIAETSRIVLEDIHAKNKNDEYEDYNVARFVLPPNVNLTSGQDYAFVVRTDYARSERKKCIHLLMDGTSTSYGKTSGKLLDSSFSALSNESLVFRVNTYKSNSNGWDNGPYWTKNPAALVREIFLNKQWGLSKPSGDVNDADFGIAYDHYKTLVGDGNGHFEPRFELDFTMDSYRPAPDQLEDIAASCLSYYVREGNKVSMRVMGSGDSVHSFGDGSSLDTEGHDNIREGSFRWRVGSLDDFANRTVIKYVEPAEKWNESAVELNDRIDQEARDVVVTEELFFPTVIRKTQAMRLGRYHSLSGKYASLEANWTGHLDASHVQIGDIVKMWHKAGLYTAKEFRVTSRIGKPDGTIDFVGQEHFNSLFDDKDGIRAPRRKVPTGPNIFAPLRDVTGLTLTEVATPQGSFGVDGDGRIVSNIVVSWTAVADDQKARMRHHRVQYSTDSGVTFTDALIAGPQDTKAVILDVQVGLEYIIRVKTVSLEGRSSSGVTASLTPQGKDDPPSDVTNFAVNLVGSELIFTWDAVQDADLQGYEIRVGSTWETGAVIDTFLTGTTYKTSNVLTGSRTYHIKAIDYSENYSDNSASDSIAITSLPDQNIVLTHNEWQRILTMGEHPLYGDLHTSGDAVLTNEFNSEYYRRALQPKTAQTWADLDALALTCAQAETNTKAKQMDQELYTGPVTYTTEAIDIGQGTQVVGTLLLDHLTASDGGGTTLTVEYATSEDNVTYSAFKPFVTAFIVTRFVKFRVTLRSTNPNNHIRLLDFKVVLDVPDITDQGKDVSISDTGTTINFNVTFVLAPKTVVATLEGDTVNKSVHVDEITKTSFRVRLRDKTDALVAGTVNWFAKGAGGVS